MQIVADEALTTGKGFTVTVEVALFVQPLALVTVTVYVVVDVGLAVGLLIPALLNPVAGVHEYVVPPVALSWAVAPTQIVAELALTTGNGFTVTVEVVVFTQPLALV